MIVKSDYLYEGKIRNALGTLSRGNTFSEEPVLEFPLMLSLTRCVLLIGKARSISIIINKYHKHELLP